MVPIHSFPKSQRAQSPKSYISSESWENIPMLCKLGNGNGRKLLLFVKIQAHCCGEGTEWWGEQW